MKKKHSDELGVEKIGSLLIKQGVPAALGILVMSINFIVDNIFIGRYVGFIGIAAITVVMPIIFLMASIGMSIGVGGASIISRALGAENRSHANRTFGNQISLTILLSFIFLLVGFLLEYPILALFGAKGDIIPVAQDYYEILLMGVPLLAFAMMSNNVIRAEGEPKSAMLVMVLAAVINMILDVIFIIYLEWGIRGAALASTLSYGIGAAYAIYFFLSKRSELRVRWQQLWPRFKVIREIFSIGFVTLARQGTVSLLAIILNNILFHYGGEMQIAVYGIINRTMMFANFPVFGATQGFLPIAGYNYGAKKYSRVRESIKVALLYGTGIAFLIFVLIISLAPQIAAVFTTDTQLIEETAPALRIVFLATPLITTQLIGSGYYQALGKAIPALLLTLTKQGFFLIPLLLILPNFWGIDGVWYAFPIADTLAAALCYWYMRVGVRKLPKEDEDEDQNLKKHLVA